MDRTRASLSSAVGHSCPSGVRELIGVNYRSPRSRAREDRPRGDGHLSRDPIRPEFPSFDAISPLFRTAESDMVQWQERQIMQSQLNLDDSLSISRLMLHHFVEAHARGEHTVIYTDGLPT